ncbi:MAG TPA: serine/threonine-protein kinase [Gemmatimonadales bacterium]
MTAPEVPPDLVTAVFDRYEIRRVLGRGGMATVYLAWDRKHHREVAVKVLRPDLAASIGSERFLKEIQIAARLNHPHILALHDSGEAGSFLFYVMPYIEGGSLRQRIATGRMLPDEALAIAAPVADALTYAHRMGVFHRDIKPENILFSHGHPVVGDFGIAKAISTAGGANLTRTGFPLGTPGYMSPEQAAGLTDLDERSDVYSLAAVVYEMIVGEIPGRWPSEEAVRIGRFLDAPPAHRARLTQAGATMEAGLVRGLAIRHEHRTATPAVLLDDLRGVAPARRQYRDDDIQEIVRRAAELEATHPTATGAMTIGGVEQLAAEVGIPAELVRSAARSLDARPTPSAPPEAPPRRNWFLGAPTRLVFERVVDGEVPDAEFPLMVDEIRRVLRNVGQVSQLGRSFAWTMVRSGGGTRSVEVVVTVRGGCTRITVQEPLGNLIGGIFGGIGGGMGGGGLGPLLGITIDGLGMGGAVAGVLVPLWLIATFATARTAYYYTVRRRTRGLEGLANRLEALARDLVVPASWLPSDPTRAALPRG